MHNFVTIAANQHQGVTGDLPDSAADWDQTKVAVEAVLTGKDANGPMLYAEKTTVTAYDAWGNPSSPDGVNTCTGATTCASIGFAAIAAWSQGVWCCHYFGGWECRWESLVASCFISVEWIDGGPKGFAAVLSVLIFRREEDDEHCRCFPMVFHWLDLVYMLLNIRFSQRLTILKLIVSL